ncbi:MAG: alkaline phosphatase family protein [Bacteroidales bacterium]|nr:alkaline phosphatase family protein [Bacteroidales bacterium]
MRLLIWVFILSIVQFHVAIAQNQKESFKNKTPKLIVGIVIEEMRYEMLLRYWDSFGDDGFKKIIDNGSLCTNAKYNYLITQNSVGHATIVTGTNPSYHGIIADTWYNRLTDKVINSTADNFSPQNLLVSSIGDEIKIGFNEKSKIISVALNPVSSVISGGRSADYAFWFNDEIGGWETGSYYTDSLPNWAKEFNLKKFQDVYMKKSWATLNSLAENYHSSLPDQNPFEMGFKNYRNTFPYELPFLQSKSGNYKYLKYTPYGNTYTKDFATSAIVGENLGKDDYPDFISISFSVTHYVNELFGPRSVEMEDAYLRLDKDLAHFIGFLDQEIGLNNVVVYITSDRGVSDIPEYLLSKKQNAGIFDGQQCIALLNSYLNILYDEGDWVSMYYARQFYINQKMLDKTGVLASEIQSRIADFVVQYAGVANAIPAAVLLSTNFESGINKKIQNSFNQKRSGDVLVNLEPGWIEKNGSVTASGSAYNYDTHVPLIWYGGGVSKSRIDKEIDMTDIAPTISWILKINSPNSSTGKPIVEIFP